MSKAKQPASKRNQPESGDVQIGDAADKRDSSLVMMYERFPGAARWPFEGLLWLGVVAAFIICAFWGVLEVHSSNDTYIGLEAGRQIMSSEEFPTQDWFSYTFEGGKWFNQNWLSHVYLWLLYDNLGPNWTIYGTWAMGWLIFTFVAGVVYLRTHSILAALVTGALVGFGCRDWLSARPATFQFTLMAGTWFALWALMSQTERKWRWWAIALLLVLFLAWPHAHGSFIFGFGLIVMVIGAEVGVQLLNIFMGFKDATRPRVFNPTMAPWQILAVGAVFVLTFLLGFLLSPFGFANYTHPFTVTESEVFRSVSEWVPPTQKASFPPVGRFWLLMNSTAVALVLVPLLFLVDVILGWLRTPAQRGELAWGSAGAPPSPVRLQVIAVDIAALIIGLYMALFARRFVPILYILAAPGIATWLMFMGSRWSPNLRLVSRISAMAAMVVFAIVVYGMTTDRYHQEIVVRGNKLAYAGLPEASFLEKVTRVDSNPRMVFKWLNENEFKPNVFTEWTLSGTMAFYVPGLQVYIDGRSQQVYDEEHYLSYQYISAAQQENIGEVLKYLVAMKTEGVILPNSPRWRVLLGELEENPRWIRVLETQRNNVFAHQDSAFWRQILAREDAGEMWWPEEAQGKASRGNVLLYMQKIEAGLTLLNEGIQRNITIGRWGYSQIIRVLISVQEFAQAEQYITNEKQRLNGVLPKAGGHAQKQIQQLINLLDTLEKVVQQQKRGNRPTRPQNIPG